MQGWSTSYLAWPHYSGDVSAFHLRRVRSYSSDIPQRIEVATDQGCTTGAGFKGYTVKKNYQKWSVREKQVKN